jgi:hypothetical protein
MALNYYITSNWSLTDSHIIDVNSLPGAPCRMCVNMSDPTSVNGLHQNEGRPSRCKKFIVKAVRELC